MTWAIVFLWFIVTGGVTILGESISTAPPELEVIPIISLLLCWFHMHCTLGKFKPAYFDLNLKRRGAY